MATRRNAILFLLALLLCAAIVFSIGWFSGARSFAHNVLLTVLATALLPFTLVAIGLALGCLLLMLSLLGAVLSGGDVDASGVELIVDSATAGADLAPWYYGWLARQRHPIAWGIAAGVVVGALALWAMIAGAVVPRETETATILACVQDRIERYYDANKRFPAPENGHLNAEVFSDGEGVIRDGFGRPLVYEVTGRGRTSAYRVRSLGFDGKPSRDDLCVHGQTRLHSWTQAAGTIARLLPRNDAAQASAKPNLRDRLEGVRALRCDGEPAGVKIDVKCNVTSK